MFNIGIISCVSGHDGAVVLRTYVDVKKKLPEFVFIEMCGTFVPYKINKVFPKGGNFIINFDDITSRIGAADIIKHKVFIPKEKMNEFIEAEKVNIKGFDIVDKNLGKIGFVEDVESYPAQDCIVAKKNLSEEKTFLIPLVDEIVLAVDEEKKIVQTNIPKRLV
jgi:ribosomal 30S subunit maturation factor RimM